MLSRRSLFSFLAGTAAVVAGTKVKAAPEWKASLDATPRPEHYVTPERQRFEIMVYETTSDPTHGHTYTPVNVRADGSIRHRQHHPVDFPARR